MQTENNFEQLNKLNARLKNLDEQGLILTLAAFADDSLGELLSAYMFQNPASKRLIGGYDAPLGTFSAKTDAAFALGLITEGQYNDLQHLRRARNLFSHTWEPISYAHRDVEKHIRAMSFSNLLSDPPLSPREKLTTSISTLLLELQVAISSAAKQRSNVKKVGSRIYAGLTGAAESNFDLCIEKFEEISQKLELAGGEDKRFLNHLKKLWIEKVLRVIANSPKEKRDNYLERLLEHISLEETKFENIYEGYSK